MCYAQQGVLGVQTLAKAGQTAGCRTALLRRLQLAEGQILGRLPQGPREAVICSRGRSAFLGSQSLPSPASSPEWCENCPPKPSPACRRGKCSPFVCKGYWLWTRTQKSLHPPREKGMAWTHSFPTASDGQWLCPGRPARMASPGEHPAWPSGRQPQAPDPRPEVPKPGTHRTGGAGDRHRLLLSSPTLPEFSPVKMLIALGKQNQAKLVFQVAARERGRSHGGAKPHLG